MEPLTTDITKEIRSVNDKFETIFGNGDAKGMASLYTEEGMLLPAGGDIIQGQEDIQRYWQGAMDMGVKQAKLESIDVEQHGTTAIELGKYTMRGENNQMIDQGKYVVVWKMENDQWRLQRDIWNSNLPAH